MPRVEKDAEVTLVVLVYRSLRWLDFVMDGVGSTKQETRYRWLIVANDATCDVANDPRIGLDFRNDDPNEFYINRVYRAWNAGVLEAPTQKVIMLNSDMLGADYWIDNLLDARDRQPRSLPTSLLIESGRLPSGMPEHVHDFGTNPDNFQREAFTMHANQMVSCLYERSSEGGKYPVHTSDLLEPGRLFMPILVDRQEFADIGMYPEGNPPGTTGDKDLIRRYIEAGFEHVTVRGSVVYHVQLGEQNWP
jgi:hypothetical protein